MTLGAVANNGKATLAGGVTGKGFVKGKSGNPKGRPKSAGLAAYIRKQTDEGKVLADFMLSIVFRQGEFEHARIPLNVRMDAATWLADRGMGKPVQVNEFTGPNGEPIEQRRVLEVVAVDYRVTAQPLLTDGE